MVLFFLSATLLPPACVATSDDEVIGSLIIAGFIAHSRLAPGSLWLPTNRSAALTTTVWMVAWVHDRTTYRWTAAHVPRTASLTEILVFVFGVAHLPNGRHAKNMDVALFARR